MLRQLFYRKDGYIIISGFMTSAVTCFMYYSISGEPFTIGDREEKGTVAKAATLLHIYVRPGNEEAPVAGLQTGVTELSVPEPVHKEQFFSSDSYCLFVNQDNQVLTIGDHYLFAVHLMRDAADPERLHVRLLQACYEGLHAWETLS